MRPPEDSRAGDRRSSSARLIRTSEVRYPGSDLTPTVPADETPSPTGAQPSRLAPALDTGIAVESRVARRERATIRRNRVVVIGAAAALCLMVLAAMGWRWQSDRTVAASGKTLEANVAEATSASSTGPLAASGQSTPVAKAVHVGPTPIFARRDKLMLHLPVTVAKLTEIGFHQASYAYALPMKTTMKDADLAKVRKTKTTGRVASKQPTGDAYLTGLVLRMWRARPGRPDTAADVGALAGTTVLSPVNGTIVKIKSYKLYGLYPDYELHITPDNTKSLDVVMIHLTKLDCYVGMRVVAGVTPIAKVRKLSDKFHDQLADYTKDPGDHVHVQVNDSSYPGYKGLQGAVEPDDQSTDAPKD